MNRRKAPSTLFRVMLPLIAVGILINFIGVRLALYFELPLFFDSVGTILVAALGGYLPGIIVGFFSNAINSASDPITLYYGILSVMFALLAAFLSRRGVFKKWWKTLLSVLLFTCIGGGLGSVLTWLLYGFSFGSGISAPFAIMLHDGAGISKFWAQFTADIGVDIADKLITLFIVFILLKLLPDKFLKNFPLGHVYMSNGSSTAIAPVRQTKKLRFSLRRKLAGMIVVTSIILSTLATVIGLIVYRDTMNTHNAELCSSAVDMMLTVIDGDHVEHYLESGGQSQDYQDTKNQLYTLRDNLPNVEYMYVYQIREDGCHVVFDLDTADVPAAAIGEVIPFDETFLPLVPDLLAGEEIPTIESNDSYGWLLTVYKPIRDSQGQCVAYAAADIAMKDIMADRSVFAIRVISLLFGASVLIVGLTLYLAERYLTQPVNSMAESTGEFAFNSEADRKKSLQNFQGLGIHTGDELENLYKAIGKMASDMMDYVQLVNEKSEDLAANAALIAKMQDNIIMSFAAMVENRDENTGEHIKHTGGYVLAIARELQRRKADTQLTEEYVANLAKSAPLHDIGKIRIPDAILNKPGRLTLDEFEQIKTHTTAGREILQNALIGIQGQSYLSQAMDMAAHHHERWDGNGYPDGLAKEQIPLCARIMAVADVFDALISKRSYKEGYPLNTAFDIIKEESGSHFDPAVVEAFFAVREEIERLSVV